MRETQFQLVPLEWRLTVGANIGDLSDRFMKRVVLRVAVAVVFTAATAVNIIAVLTTCRDW